MLVDRLSGCKGSFLFWRAELRSILCSSFCPDSKNEGSEEGLHQPLRYTDMYNAT